MPASGVKPQFGATVFNGDHHVCAFFRNKDDEFRTLTPFILEGLAAGEKAIHVVNTGLREGYRRRMTAAGADVDALERSGQLQVISWPTSPRRGTIDRPATLKMIDQVLRAAGESGYPRTRIIGEMDWAVRDAIPADELVALEAQLHDVYARHPVWVVCAYDLTHFGSAVVLDVLRTHPAALIGGVFQRNPFYIKPEQMLEELRARGEIARDRQSPDEYQHRDRVE